MREVLPRLLGWWRDGPPVAMATVVATWRSAPRAPGAVMLVGPDGEAVGSVSGGCVEGAVYEVAQQVLADGAAVRVSYGVSDDDAFAVGLTCGGTIELVVARVEPGEAWLEPLAAAVAAREPVALATVASQPGDVGARLLLGADGAVTGSLGGRVGIAPRLFLKKLVADVLDRIDLHADFDPRVHYQLTVADDEMTTAERSAAKGVDDVELQP